MDRNRSFDVKIAAILLALSILLMSALGITGWCVSSRLMKEAGGGNLTAHKTSFTKTASDAATVCNGYMTVPHI
ncbi:MAG: hypothetical protein Q8878_01785, partial [Bacillota bacterium]|nr:hypothetical protein [Bacillota bacterium]